ncbi:AzlD domain-containing protein [Allohahella marinimesophila]|uniref:AzlD domain-containing protein n=1 Tax=Allohahella marinimesophila TaxID=1054972 RepID=A0ABP7PVF9_9GAMM
MTQLELVGFLAVMTLATLSTRGGGVILMSVVPMGPRVQRFLRALSGSVLVALVAPAMLSGDWAIRAGAAVCLLAMLLQRGQLVALTTGVLTVGLVRAFL